MTKHKKILSTTLTADEQYQKEYQDALWLLESIQRGLENERVRQAQDPRNWGFVGNIHDLNATLQDLSDRLHNTGEYGREGESE